MRYLAGGRFEPQPRSDMLATARARLTTKKRCMDIHLLRVQGIKELDTILERSASVKRGQSIFANFTAQDPIALAMNRAAVEPRLRAARRTAEAEHDLGQDGEERRNAGRGAAA
jgi:hypothetical protein